MQPEDLILPEPKGDLKILSPAQFHVLFRRSQAFSPAQIAVERTVSPATIKSNVKDALTRLPVAIDDGGVIKLSAQELRRLVIKLHDGELWVKRGAATRAPILNAWVHSRTMAHHLVRPADLEIPTPKGKLQRLSPAQFHVAYRRAQGWAHDEIARERRVQKLTVSGAVTEACARFTTESDQGAVGFNTQQLTQLVLELHDGEMWIEQNGAHE